MKKRIALAIALILALATVFVLASCGGGNDGGCTNHTYSTEYTTDANGHWYEATCGCEGEVANYGAHKDEDKNGKCDTCQYVLCAHTFADTWSSDENTHYYQSTCECAPQKKDEATHTDANKDGVCDVCEYVVCAHKYAQNWSSDEENHWKAPVCGCEIENIELGAHADANKDGGCDVCEYVVCAHTYADTWSSDGAYHWYAATCGCDVVKDKAEHNGDDDDASCPTCGASICKHTYEDTLTYDQTHHWYASTCGCDIVKDKEEHKWSSAWEKDGINHWHKTECGCEAVSGTEEHNDSDDEDSRCDKCGQLDFASLMGNIDEYIGEERNEYVADILEQDPINEYNYPSFGSIKIYDNYTLIADNYGNKKYISYCGQYNDIPFVINVDSDNYVLREFDYDDSSLISLSGVFDIATGTSLEEYVFTLYTLGISENASGFNYFCDEENSKYSFTYYYNAGYYYVHASVEFTLDEDIMGVTSLNFYEERYEAELYVEGGENTVVYTVQQTITQGFGEPHSSENEPNPYPASDYLLTELELYKATVDMFGDYVATTERITDGCTVTIAPDYTNGLHIVVGGAGAAYAEFNKFTIESTLEGGWVNYPVMVYATSVGTYDVTVSNELDSISFTVVVEYKEPSRINAAVVNEEGEKIRTKEYEIFAGLDFVLGIIPGTTADSPLTSMPTVTSGDASKLSFVKDGENWKVTTSAAGEYVITLASALNSSVTTTLTLTVKEAPTVAEILNGYYEIVENLDGISGSIKFIPSENGATNGTAILKMTIAGNPLIGEEDQVCEATLTYVYENGNIVLTVTEGDSIENYSFYISDRYELMVVRTPYLETPDYTIEYKLMPAKEIIIREPTQSPFTMTVSDTYTFLPDDEFIFVAGEDGKYVFNLPKGYGLLSNSKPIATYLSNVNGVEFTLNLKAGDEVSFIPQATEVGDFTVYFHVEKENKVTDINGLGGVYNFTLVVQFELTFTPDYHGASSGTLKVKDPVSSNNSGTFRYTIVDGDYVFADDVAIYITRDLGDNWFFQGPSLQMPQQFSGPTYYEAPKVEEIPYNGYKDENALGGIYTVTVDGNEYKIIMVPSSDGASGAGKLQIYNASTDTYLEAYEYVLMFNDYFFTAEGVMLYRENAEWFITAEGLNAVKLADATVIPEPEDTTLEIGENAIKINPDNKENGGKLYTLTPSEKGEFTFSGDLDVYIFFGGNPVKVTGKITLEKDVTYVVVINATGEAGEYTLDLSFVPVSDGGGKGEFEDDEF